MRILSLEFVEVGCLERLVCACVCPKCFPWWARALNIMPRSYCMCHADKLCISVNISDLVSV